MKKIIISILFALLFLLLPNYASNPDIIVAPEKCLVNDSVYVIFQWRAPYAVENFNITVYSDAIEFNESTLYYAGVAEDAKVFHIFKGRAVKPGNHTIKIQMSYIIEGISVKRKFLGNITIITLPITEVEEKNVTLNKEEDKENKILNKTENITQQVNITTNTTISNKTTNNIEDIINMQKNESVTIQNNQGNIGSIIYGIFGLALGLAFGYVVMYLIKL
ncbi:hypothetical protein [Methanocaldococcus fervens]|uniref:Uncharacterized protein n=1 Tax=Methanocaldococcus fervens (strain DSM 4213 / JCM 15782 / AG86) TaxID=573064 RepID=C7P7S7_METFA|nr:hypothetical protein [Methanocaldococcus fervens]ACV24609.1 hypothetical protein Mefer_0791 [Methanocaldococcus fervens AG86]